MQDQITKVWMKIKRCYIPPNPRGKYNARYLEDRDTRENFKITLSSISST